jgi:hypothetical protein
VAWSAGRAYIESIVFIQPGSGTSGADSSSVTTNSLQQMMSRRANASQNKEWKCEPLVPSRDIPKAYVDSAGGTYEEYVWEIESYS